MSIGHSIKYDRKYYDAKRDKVRELRDQLFILIYPHKDYVVYFVEYYPETNTPVMKRKIRNVVNGITTSDSITIMLEKIVEKLKTKQYGTDSND